jgi:phosphonate transport system substrate-binding protein
MTDASQPTFAKKGGFDANLELPLADPYWSSLFTVENCEITSTIDLDTLTAALLKHQYDFSYLPSANCYFLRDDHAWRGLASALSPRTKSPAQSSVFVVKRSNPATSWQQLKGAKLGYINTYCTTSYFAPSILLAREDLALETFFDAFAVAPWQGQIDAVIDGSIDATMVYEDVWLAQSSNAGQTRIIARLDDLPTPPVIALASLEAPFTSKLTSALIAFAPKPVPGMLYAGFASYQDMRMRRFFAELEKVPGLGSHAPQASAHRMSSR